MILLGSALLIWEAWKKYDLEDAVVGPAATQAGRRAELAGVRMSALTTKHEYVRGKLFYVLSFLVLYALCLLTPELVGVLVGDANVDKAVTAQTEISSILRRPGEAAAVGSLDGAPTVPLMLAVAIVVGATTPTFGVVERTVRSISYAFAGIPRGIHRVLRNVEALDFTAIAQDDQLPMVAKFQEFTEAHEIDPVMQQTVDYIFDALRRVELLQAPVVGPMRTRFWNVYEGAAPLERVNEARDAYLGLRDELSALRPDGESLEYFQVRAQTVADSLQCLFALYAIRNAELRRHQLTTSHGRILQQVVAPELDRSANEIAWAAILGSVAALVLAWLWGAAMQLDIHPLSADMRAMLTYMFNSEAQAMLEDGRLAFSSAELTDRVRLQGATALNDVRLVMVENVLPLAVAFGLSAYATIKLRRHRIDENAWPEETGPAPLLTYLRLTPLPTAVGVLAFLAMQVICTGAGGADLAERTQNAIDLVGTKLDYALKVVALLLVFFECALLLIADQHNRRSWWVTLLIALVGGGVTFVGAQVVAFLLQVDGGNRSFSELQVAMLGLVPLSVILAAYALSVELGEVIERREAAEAAAQAEVEAEAPGGAADGAGAAAGKAPPAKPGAGAAPPPPSS
ncbi:hypothetical protein ACQ5SO_16610, partial [Rhodovulum sp. DZ06]|uniref:hypothetical protein n=1 Tax=Rhodovulum sp. DZ06 TaxID=3425126 RepID=UPI003D341682